MYRTRSRREEIGWIVALADGSVDLYDTDVSKLPGVQAQESVAAHRVAAPAGLDRLSAPITAAMELTLACNLTCTHCFISAGDAREHELDTARILRNAKELADAGVMFTWLTGGEASMRPDFVEIVRGVADTGLDFNIISNTTGLSRTVLSRIPPETTFVVSVDGIGAHQLIRGRQTFAQVSSRILALRAAGFPVIGSVVVNHVNLPELPELYRWATANRVILTALDLQTVGRAARYAEQLRLTAADVDAYRRFVVAKLTYEELLPELYEESFDGHRIHSNPFYYGFEEQLMLQTGLNYQGNFYVYVASDGQVYPDNFYAGDGLYPAGRLGDRPFDEIWGRIRDLVNDSNYASFDCTGCPVDAAGIFCDFKSAALSLYLHGKPNVCGATEVEKAAMLMRTDARLAAAALPAARQFDNF